MALRRGIVLLALVAAVSSANAEMPLPEFYGLYVVSDGKLYGADHDDPGLREIHQPVRLARTEQDFKSGGVVAQLPVFSPSLNLLVFVKESPLSVASQMKLRELSFVRRMTINENDASHRQTYELNTWVAGAEFGYTDLGTEDVELRFKPVKGEDEMVLAVPAAPLEPGLFILGANFIFAVAPLETAAEAKCIDAKRPVGAFVSWRTLPCAASPSVDTSADAGGSQASPTPSSGAPEPNLISCAESSMVSTPEDFRGTWTGELQQGALRYAVRLELETGGGDLLQGTISYPSLNCSGTLQGQVNVTTGNIGALITETIRVRDRLKCLSGSKVKLVARPEAGGLLAEWYSRGGTVDASGVLCRQP